jgi:hypothetical protein
LLVFRGNICVLTITLFASGCGGVQSVNLQNTGTWGHLKHGQTQWLANLKPDSMVTFCGDLQNEAAQALSQWISAAGREGRIEVTTGCSSEADEKIVVATSDHLGTSKLCQAPSLGAAARVDTRSIIVCDLELKNAYLLHEMGHLWGMCDVYPESVRPSNNCDPKWFTGRNVDSVMGANMSEFLTVSDKVGAAALVNRQDLPGFLLWNREASAPTESPTTQNQ